MKIQLLQPGLVLFESALFRTVTTLYYTDRMLLLVDPNWLPEEVKFIQRFIDDLGGKRERFLLFTHSDYDHIIGYGAFPEYTTIASQRFVDNPEAEKQLAQAVDFDDKYYIRRNYDLVYPRIDLPVADKPDTLKIAGSNPVFHPGQGHNYDGIITFFPETGTLIVGDYLSNIEFPYVYHSFADYRSVLSSLERIIQESEPRILITGHGDHTRDTGEMQRRIDDSRTYLDDLETSVTQSKPLDTEALFQRYGFPGIMGEFHAANVRLFKKEFERRLSSSARNSQT